MMLRTMRYLKKRKKKRTWRIPRILIKKMIKRMRRRLRKIKMGRRRMT